MVPFQGRWLGSWEVVSGRRGRSRPYFRARSLAYGSMEPCRADRLAKQVIDGRGHPVALSCRLVMTAVIEAKANYLRSRPGHRFAGVHFILTTRLQLSVVPVSGH